MPKKYLKKNRGNFKKSNNKGSVANINNNNNQETKLCQNKGGQYYSVCDCCVIRNNNGPSPFTIQSTDGSNSILRLEHCSSVGNDNEKDGAKRGGTATVLKAFDAFNKRCVAVKRLNPESADQATRQQFRQEDFILKMFQVLRRGYNRPSVTTQRKQNTIAPRMYPHIVRRVISGNTFLPVSPPQNANKNNNAKNSANQQKLQQQMVIVEEFGARNLEEFWQNELRMNGDRKDGELLMDIVWDILYALQEFHEVAYHLDFKPKNIIVVEVPIEDAVNPRGEKATSTTKDNMVEKVLKLIDFGSSRKKLPRRVNAKDDEFPCVEFAMEFGTPDFLSPEQLETCTKPKQQQQQNRRRRRKRDTLVFRHRVSEKSDIWALGITIYLLLFDYNHPPIVLNRDEVAHPWKHAKVIAQKQRELNVHLDQAVPQGRLDRWLDDQRYAHYLPLLINVIKQCLQFEPALRPTASGIIDYLNGECHFATEIDFGLVPEPSQKKSQDSSSSSEAVTGSTEATGIGEFLTPTQKQALIKLNKERFDLQSLFKILRQKHPEVINRFHRTKRRREGRWMHPDAWGRPEDKPVCERRIEDPVAVPPIDPVLLRTGVQDSLDTTEYVIGLQKKPQATPRSLGKRSRNGFSGGSQRRPLPTTRTSFPTQQQNALRRSYPSYAAGNQERRPPLPNPVYESEEEWLELKSPKWADPVVKEIFDDNSFLL